MIFSQECLQRRKCSERRQQLVCTYSTTQHLYIGAICNVKLSENKDSSLRLSLRATLWDKCFGSHSDRSLPVIIQVFDMQLP